MGQWVSERDRDMAQSKPDPSKIAKGKCPICGDQTDYESRPFCSRRCSNIDLYRWLSNSYAIPGHEDEDEDGDNANAAASLASREPGAEDEQDK